MSTKNVRGIIRVQATQAIHCKEIMREKNYAKASYAVEQGENERTNIIKGRIYILSRQYERANRKFCNAFFN